MHAPERRAVLLLLGLAVLGQAVRYLATRPGQAAGGVQLLSTLTPGSPSAQRESAVRQARPLVPGERIDADSAGAAELARLPRVGMSLAKAIVANREAHGPFGSLSGLDRVPGVGPGLLHQFEPYLSFSGSGSGPAVQASATLGTSLAPPPLGEGLVLPKGISAPPLNLNTATAIQLEGLPGIGPSLARRIVAYREARGPFATVHGLDQVPGIGPALLAKLGQMVTAP